MKRHKHSGRYLSKTPRGRYAWKRRPVHNHMQKIRRPLNRFRKRYTDSEGVTWETNEFGFDVRVDDAPTLSRQADRMSKQSDLDMGIAEQIRAAQTRDELMKIPDIKETVSNRAEQDALMDIYRQQLNKVMGKGAGTIAPLRASESMKSKVSTEELEFDIGKNRLYYEYVPDKEHYELLPFFRRPFNKRAMDIESIMPAKQLEKLQKAGWDYDPNTGKLMRFGKRVRQGLSKEQIESILDYPMTHGFSPESQIDRQRFARLDEEYAKRFGKVRRNRRC